MNKIRFNKLNTDKGFTLVELIVVLVLMSILLSVGVFGVLGWIDWVTFTKENDSAEDIFYAAQNQLTELDSSGALELKVQDALKTTDGKYIDKYVLAQGTKTTIKKNNFTNIINSAGYNYEWTTLWMDTNVDEERTLIRLVADAGDYSEYSSNPTGYTSSSINGDPGTKLLFELIAPYISDKSVLNGSIAIEFSPEAGQVFSVCYSDKKGSFADEENAGYLDITNRTLARREKEMLGYFAVETLTSKRRGRNEDNNSYLLQIENENSLNLVIGYLLPVASGIQKKKICFEIQGASDYTNGNLDYSPVMSFELLTDNISDKAISLKTGAEHPVAVNITFDAGLYKEDSKTFYLPVWRKDGNIYIALDAADIQAQSLTYAGACGVLDDTISKESYQNAFKNSFSFYRFGLYNVRYIRAKAGVANLNEDPIGMVEACRAGTSEVYSSEDGKIHGEAATFANYDDANNEDANIYGIINGRHLYNVRFESDYSDSFKKKNLINSDINRKFVLKSDINWKTFAENCLLNSYEAGKDNGETVWGINIDSNLSELAAYTDAEGKLDVTKMPFPGFRVLSYEDIFTQNADLAEITSGNTNDKTYKKLSNLNISFAANCIYGVYGETIQKKITADHDYDYVSAYGKTGFLPLGLFAENFGEISNIELDDTTVSGIDVFHNGNINTPSLITSKVGGFTGENFGTLKNLYIDEFDSVNSGGTTVYSSHISGRSDVGGIVGHQYKVAVASGDGAETPDTSILDAKIEKCINNAKVTGIGYVGGIIGRIYPGGMAEYDSTIFGYGLTEGTYGLENVNIKRFSDNYIVTGGNSYTLEAASSYSIENCANYGEISMDSEFVRYTLDGVTLRRGFYFGGITGAAFYNYTGNDADFCNGNSESKASIKNCISYTIYDNEDDNGDDNEKKYDKLKELINPQMSNTDQVLKSRSRLRMNFVGGIAGYTKYAKIENCSNTPDKRKVGENKYSLVVGDRYVGGIVGASVQTIFSGDSAYNTAELAKITDQTSGYRNDYNIINGSIVLGNYAVGGVAGSFGKPLYNGSREVYGNNLEDAYKNNYDYPVNCGHISNSSYRVVGLLNTSVVLGYSFNSKLNKTTDANDTMVGRNFYGVGGIAGLLSATIDNADNIQTEETKLLNLELICLETNVSASKPKDFLPDDEYETNYKANSVENFSGKQLTDHNADNINKIKGIIGTTQFVTDGVGGIAGHGFDAGNINIKNKSTYYKSKVDAIVFGRNRVGGGIGDTTANNDRAGKTSIANIVPSKVNSSSSGLYVIGYDCVGGMVGAYKDNANRSQEICPGINITEDYDTTNGKFTVGYHVIGYRAVGGLIGTCTETSVSDSEYAPKTIHANFESPRTDYITIAGSLYVGGIVGMQEGYSDTADYRYYVKMTNVKIKADCFGGIMVGATYSDEYFPLDRLMHSENKGTNEEIKCVDLYVKEAAAFVSGLYAYNGNTGQDGDASVLYNNTINDSNNSNYKVEYSATGISSLNGLCNVDKINNFHFNSDLLTNTDNIIKTFNDKPASAEQKTMNLNNLSSNGSAGSANEGINESRYHNRIWGDIFVGGLFGFVPDYTYIEIEEFRNRICLKSRSYILSREAGENDDTKYSYLGSVIGRVPKGMTLKNCYNSSPDRDYNSYIYSYDSNNYATYKGGLTEVNAGYIYNHDREQAEGMVNVQDAQAYMSQPGFNGNVNCGGYAGVNGTKDTHGTSVTPYEGVIESCNNIQYANVYKIKGSISGGIAASAGGKSAIIGCTNGTIVQGRKVGNNIGIAGGILGNVMECVPEGTEIRIEACVNYGDVTSEVTNSKSAGIAYDTNSLADIICCRNYSNKPKYAITSSETGNKAKSIKYCFDASNITKDSNRHSVFGDISADRPSDNMVANFYKGSKKPDVTPTIDPTEYTGFEAYQLYSTPDSEMPDAAYNVVGDRTHISDKVLGGANSGDMYDKVSNNANLSYEVYAVNGDGIYNNVYADMNKLQIVWENSSNNNSNGAISEYLAQAETLDTTGEAYQTFVSEEKSFLNIARDVYQNKTSKPEGYADQGIAAYVSEGDLEKYAYAIFLYMTESEEIAASSDDAETDYIAFLYNNAIYMNGNGLAETITYKLVIYDAYGEYISISGITASLSETESTQTAEFDIEALGQMGSGLNSGWTSGIPGNQSVTAFKTDAFNKDMISKVYVMVDVDYSTSASGQAGINAFNWTKARSEESVAMPTNNVGAANAFATANSKDTTLDIIVSKKVSLTGLYFEPSSSNPYDLYLNGYTTGINQLISEDIEYSEADTKYKSFMAHLYPPQP